ncbi:hypothetical protein DOY81_001860, partial [Sarcophaga bullata]
LGIPIQTSTVVLFPLQLQHGVKGFKFMDSNDLMLLGSNTAATESTATAVKSTEQKF